MGYIWHDSKQRQTKSGYNHIKIEVEGVLKC